MLNSTKLSARACCAVAQRAAFVQRFFSASPRLLATEDGWDDGNRSSPPSLRVIFDSDPDSELASEGGVEDFDPSSQSSIQGALKKQISVRHKVLFERLNDSETLGLWRYKNFRLPGDVTLGDDYKKLIVPAHRRTFSALENFKQSPDLIRAQQRNQIETVRQFDVVNRLNNQKIKFSGIRTNDQLTKPFNFIDRVQCTAHECPLLIRMDFADSFPEVHLRNEQNFTVITISEKPSVSEVAHSANDDDENSANERTRLAKNETEPSSFFSDAAREVCRFLQASGCWADFVDPFSGKLYGAGTAAPAADEASSTADDQRALDRFAGASVERCYSCTVISTSPLNPMTSSTKLNNDDVIDSSAPASDARGLVFTSASIDSPVLKFLLDYSASSSSAAAILQDNGDAVAATTKESAAAPASMTSSPPTGATRSRDAELLKKIFERY